MSEPRDYNAEVTGANIDATIIAALGIPAAAFLDVIQTEFETGQAQPEPDQGIILDGLELLCDQQVVDWKGMVLTGGMFMVTSVQRGLQARKDGEYQRFMLASGMELGDDTFLHRAVPRVARGAALIGAYALGTRLSLGANLAGAFALTGGALGYGMIKARSMGWPLFSRRPR